MVDYRKLKSGEKLKFHTEEFDGNFEVFGEVVDVYDDHATMTDYRDIYWIDDDTAELFYKVEGAK